MIIGLLVGAFVVVGCVCGIAAAAEVHRINRRMEELRREISLLRQSVAAQRVPTARERPGPAPTAVPQEPAPRPEEAAPVSESPAPVPEAPAATPEVPGPVPAEPAAVESVAGPRDGTPGVTPLRSLSWGDLEQDVGKRWMTWAGVLAIFVSVSFFVKYAIDHKWLGPEARVILGILVGIVMLIAGDRFIRRAMRALGQGLVGGGLAVLYVSLYAAFQLYGLISQPVAFALMVMVTAAGMGLAIRHDAIPISFLAVLGGLLTPVLVSTGRDARDALFGYLLILDLGVLGVALFKRWRALDVLAFVGTGSLFAAWYWRFYTVAAMVPTLLWLGAFYLVFLLLPFVRHLRERTPATIERFLMAMIVAAGVFSYAHHILYAGHRHALGLIALGMAGCYGILGVTTRMRVPDDKRGVLGFISLAILFATISVPLEFGLNGITLVWAAEGPALLYLGYRFGYPPGRFLGLGVLVIAVVRLFARHWPLHDGEFRFILNPQFGVAMFVSGAMAVFALLHHRWRDESETESRILKVAAGLGAGVLAAVCLHGEGAAWFANQADRLGVSRPYLARCAGAVVWTVAGLGFVVTGVRTRCYEARVTGIVGTALAVVLGMSLHEAGLLEGQRHFLNARFYVALSVLLGCFLQCPVLARQRDLSLGEAYVAPTQGIVAGLLLLLAIHIELAGWLGLQGAYPARVGVTLLWALAPAAFLAAGIAVRSLGSRIAGLAVLAGAVGMGVRLYESGLIDSVVYFFNLRFLAALVVVLTGFACGYLLRCYRERVEGAEAEVAKVIYWISGYLLILVLHKEWGGWLGSWGTYPARLGVTVLWTAGSAVFLAVGVRARSLPTRVIGLGLLAVAGILAGRLYEAGVLQGFLLLLNLRFAACIVVILVAFGHGFGIRRWRGPATAEEREVAGFICWAATFLLLVLLSKEAYDYSQEQVAGADKGRWVGQMSLSIVWSVYALALLVVGFWRRARAVRFAGLIVFGATALKLVAVDLAGVREAYRIVSFFVMGSLMVGASYLYHRIEKRLNGWRPRGV